MRTDEYQRYDGLGLAALLRSGEVSPLDLMRCAISLAEDRGARHNALIFPKFDAALGMAERPSPAGAFGALPFLLKDSGLASRFLPTSMGSRLFGAMTSSIDATV